MIQIKYGDLLEAKGIIVHGCNAQGVMGSGVAKQIKERWPECFREYQRHLKSFLNIGDSLGTVAFWTAYDEPHRPVVANGITQKTYGRKGLHVDYKALRDVFKQIKEVAFVLNECRINFPLIGCGLGGGDWEIVSKIIDEELDDKFEKILWLKE